MSQQEMLQFLRARYQEHGIGSLSYSSIKKVKGFYWAMNRKGMKLNRVIEHLGLTEEYEKFKEQSFTKVVDGKRQRRWSWERVVTEASTVVKEQGFLPPAQWFQLNGLGTLVAFVYHLEKDWNDLRACFASYEHSTFVESRNGMRWRSHPEASLSNFLYARGIEHKKGEKYPDSYGEYGESRYAYYDLHFVADSAQWIDVEIWGDKPFGHKEQHYRKVRAAKEEFNRDNDLFLGIHFQDCYSETRLESILAPHIGCIAPFVFARATDRMIHSTHWSNADELIECCREIAAGQPTGVFPTEEWLRKRGKWKHREGPVYNTVSVYIKKWIGGVRRLRIILDQQEFSTTAWTREEALKEYRAWYEQYGFTPGQARSDCVELSDKEVRRANNISAATAKYVGPVSTANRILGIKPVKRTKWSRERILEECSRMFQVYSMTPSQLARLSRKDRQTFAVDEDDIVLSRQIVDRTGAYFAGASEIYSVLNLAPVDMRILRRRRTSTGCR